MDNLLSAIKKASDHQLTLQHPDGYWWYTLEANETICAEAVFLMYFMGEVDESTVQGLARRILSRQREDGTWAIYWQGPADLSTTIECYWALKLAGYDTSLTNMSKARDFILSRGGITHARVFTKIHLAQFGLVPWNVCPAMPLELILFPTWSPVNVYEFSSWARASIIPLLVVLNKKPVRPLPYVDGRKLSLEELFAEPPSGREWDYKADANFISWQQFFLGLDKFLKFAEKIPRPFEGPALKKCEEWICEHIAKTEDIYPALAYGAIALSCLGYSNSHPIIRKALDALKFFRQEYNGKDLPAIVDSSTYALTRFAQSEARRAHLRTFFIHQQCCISPVWDTPWQITALLNSGVSPNHPALLKAGNWLIDKQITSTNGDWRVKNQKVLPGGWSFEFENEYFPDTDDTIQVLHVLNRLELPQDKKNGSISRGLEWLMSMQSKDGGWAAFDVDQDLTIVNKIPFSDHGACLDEPCADVTGRILALAAELNKVSDERIRKAIDFLKRTQTDFGAWSGRWGVNYIYGTWCALTGLAAIGEDIKQPYIQKAIHWLKSIQHKDGGWSESPESYKLGRYEPYPRESLPTHQRTNEPTRFARSEARRANQSVPSQTAWALMGLIAAGASKSDEARHGARFLINTIRNDGTWDEKEYTGTGFPGHFYIRYHGYRHFFPLMALGLYSNVFFNLP